MTVLTVCTVVFAIVVVRDTVSEEGLCRDCGGTCLTFGGAVTNEEVAPCSLWKKDDIVGSRREKGGKEEGRRGGKRSRGETTSFLDCFRPSAERRRNRASQNQSIYARLCKLTSQEPLAVLELGQMEGSHLESIASFWILSTLGTSLETPKSYSCVLNDKTTRPCQREMQELLGLQATLRTSEK